MESLFANSIAFFVWHPERAAWVGLLFLLAAPLCYALKRPKIPTLITGIFWLLYAFWEWHCKEQRYDIRVDLFLVYPILFTCTLGGLAAPLLHKETDNY
jgi:hypothetical protein